MNILAIPLFTPFSIIIFNTVSTSVAVLSEFSNRVFLCVWMNKSLGFLNLHFWIKVSNLCFQSECSDLYNILLVFYLIISPLLLGLQIITQPPRLRISSLSSRKWVQVIFFRTRESVEHLMAKVTHIHFQLEIKHGTGPLDMLRNGLTLLSGNSLILLDLKK